MSAVCSAGPAFSSLLCSSLHWRRNAFFLSSASPAPVSSSTIFSASARPAPLAVAALAAQVASDAALDDVLVEGSDDVVALVDPDHLSQILWNLLSNGHRHGAPPVRVVVDSRDGHAVVEVRDAGDGVEAALHDRLFQRFGRGRASRGMGIGLSISRDLARVNGGELTYTQGDDGHAFVVELPLP